MTLLASRSMSVAFALAISIGLAGCQDTPPPKALALTMEIAEVDPSAPLRHLFDKEGKPIDLGIVSSVRLKATASNVWMESGKATDPSIPMSPEAGPTMDLSFAGDDAEVFRKWTGARQQKVMAMIVDDQTYAVATIQAELRGITVITLPTVIRSEPLKNFVEQSLR